MADFEREREEHIQRLTSEHSVVERRYGIWHPASRYGGEDWRRRLVRLLLLLVGFVAFLFVVAIVGAWVTG